MRTRLKLAEAAACATNAPSLSPSSKYGRKRRYCSAESAGIFTALRINPSARYSRTCSAIAVPTSSCASAVEPAMCGVAIRFGKPTSGEFFGGSVANVSTAAPASWPERSASARAASSINSPRAQLIRRAPFFIFAIAVASIIFSVEPLSDVCSETTSDWRKTSSTGSNSTSTSRAAAGVTNGSYATTFISSPRARRATSVPTRPRPTSPSVFPRISVPENADFSHQPAWVEAFASSAADALVALRMINASASVSSLGSAAGAGMTTSHPVSRSSAIPRSLILSATIIFMGHKGIGRTRTCQLRAPLATRVLLFRAGRRARMSYIERIEKDLTVAMREKSELRLSVLRMVKSALKYKEVEKKRALDDLESLQVLQTLVKQRRESVDQFTKGGRKDLAEKEGKEIAIIEHYLPAAPSDEEIHRAVEAAIVEAGADSLKQMGAVIKAARARLEGKAVDGKVLSDRVRQRLTPKS